MNRYNLQWKVGFASDPSSEPERFVPATVPGAVQLDWASSEGWPSYWQDNDYERYGWMEGMYWFYESTLSFPQMEPEQRLFFVCGGVDYRFLVRVKGRTIHGQEGMFTPFECDLTEIAEDGDRLQIIVFPVPQVDLAKGRRESNQSVKPVVSYGWDFHPRLVPSGIWKETYLEVRSERFIEELSCDSLLSDDLTLAQVDFSVALNGPCHGSLEWSLLTPQGDVVDGNSVAVQGQSVVDALAECHDPDLWWPNGYGEQPLYSVNVSLHDDEGRMLDFRTLRLGFRRVRLVMNEGAGNDPKALPKTRSVPPMVLEVNGVRLFAKGSNWVAPDIFPGVLGADAYRPLLEKAVGAHLNLLRCWGGSAVNKPSFYELCDELGLMVWQDFPLLGSYSDESPEYLDTLNQESLSVIKQLKSHPCIALWCGGNELNDGGGRINDQRKAIRLLNKNCFELDQDTPFLATTPIMGVGQGGFLFRDDEGRECFQVFQEARNTAYLEFGVPGPAPLDRLKSVIAEDELFPPRRGGDWEKRHAFGAWQGHPDTWLCFDMIQSYFGRPETPEELVDWGQLLQAEGYKAIFEEARRQKPHCSMAVNWCFNEPWPAAASDSLIAWPCEPKPAYRAVRQSCRPTLASGRVSKFSWREGEMFEAELWMLNDAPRSVKGDRVEAYLRFDDEEVFVLGWYFDTLEAGENGQGPVLRYKMPEVQGLTFSLILKVEGRPDWNSEYQFCVRRDG